MQEIVVAINRLSDKIKTLEGKIEFLTHSPRKQLEEAWFDNQEVLEILHISVRTLQYLRTYRTLPYSKINGKVYYKASDVKALLEKNYPVKK